MSTLHRRSFLRSSAAAVSALSALGAAGAAGRPNEKIVVAVMGVRGRGRGLISNFAACDDVDIAYLCDPDENVIPDAVKILEKKQKKTPRVEKDVRRVLEDKAVTALVIAA